ncbi:MAG TPA: endospore germination permease [Bacillales bacterium]|nr:endospore germination permease [Bacillales bacterium]
MANRNVNSQISQEPKEESTKFVITSRQQMALITSTLIGAGVLTLPRQASEEAHQAAWIATLLGGLFAFLVTWAITRLALRFPGKTFVEYIGDLLGVKKSETVGKYIGLPITLFYIAIWLAMAITSTRLFGETIVSAVLTNTPIQVIIGTLLFTVFFYMMVEVEVVARFNELLLPLIIVPLVLIAFLTMQNIHLTNMLPLISVNWLAFVKSVGTQIFAYQGLSVMLLFMAFVQRGDNTRATAAGIGLPVLSYVMIVFASVGVFGFEELQHLTWPTLELIKSSDIRLFLLQRVESGFVVVWVVAVFTTVGNLCYGACFAAAQCLPTKKEDKARKWIAVFVLPIVFIVSLLPQSVYALFRWLSFIGYVGLIAFVLPVVMLLLAVVRKQGKGGNSHESS